MSRSNWLDRTISFMSPAAGAARAQARMKEAAVQKLYARHFEGAAQGRRTKGWRSPGTSANAALVGGLVTLRNRSRDLDRNNTYASRAINVIATETVGTGIIPRPRAIIEDSRAGKRAAANLVSLWTAWGESTLADADGMLSAYGIQDLAMRTIARDGEVLIRRRWRRSSDGLPVPLQLQVLEVDHIDITRDQLLQGGGRILQGIEFDALGRRVAYWLYPTHPGEVGLTGASLNLKSVRVPASEIIHRFDVQRAGQVRGIPQGAPCLLKLRDFDEYEDAQLLRQKISAMFAGFIKDMEMPDELGEDDKEEDLKLEAGLVQDLPRGKEIIFPNTPQVNDDGHSSRVLHAIASGFGVTYESLTQDFRGVNYSSARMARIQFWRNLDRWQYMMMIPGVCAPIWQWFVEAAAMTDYAVDGVTVKHTAPHREMLDPTKEIPAAISEMRSGLLPWSQAVLERGEDPDQVLAQYKADQKKFDEAGVVFLGDGRKPAAGGPAAAPAGKPVVEDDDKEDSDEA